MPPPRQPRPPQASALHLGAPGPTRRRGRLARAAVRAVAVPRPLHGLAADRTGCALAGSTRGPGRALTGIRAVRLRAAADLALMAVGAERAHNPRGRAHTRRAAVPPLSYGQQVAARVEGRPAVDTGAVRAGLAGAGITGARAVAARQLLHRLPALGARRTGLRGSCHLAPSNRDIRAALAQAW
jgi:hypothetical protein